MNPAMLAYLQNNYQQQMQGNSQNGMPPDQQMMPSPQMTLPQQEEYNPFQNGATAAMEAARQSRQPTEDDNRKAFGKALMAFSSRMAKPTGVEGFGGTLQALNDSFTPGYEAYEQEQQRAEAQNAAMMQAYQQQQLMEAAQQQKQAQYMQALEEKKRHQAEELAYKREHDQQMNQLHRDQFNSQKDYRNQKLSFQEKMMRKKIEEAQTKGKPLSPQLISNISKELEHLEAAENEYKNYEVAEELLNKGDPLFNPVAEKLYSVVGGRPEGFLNPDQALFKEMAGDLRGQIANRLGFKTDSSRRGIETIDPKKSAAANLKIIKQSKDRLHPLLEKKKRYQALINRMMGGENPTLEEEAFNPSQPSPQNLGSQEWIMMIDPKTGDQMEVHIEDVAKAQQQGAHVINNDK